MKVLGIALTVIGAGLLFWAFQMSNSVGQEVTEAVTGSFTDNVMIFYIGGAAAFAVGLYLSTKK